MDAPSFNIGNRLFHTRFHPTHSSKFRQVKPAVDAHFSQQFPITNTAHSDLHLTFTSFATPSHGLKVREGAVDDYEFLFHKMVAMREPVIPFPDLAYHFNMTQQQIYRIYDEVSDAFPPRISRPN